MTTPQRGPHPRRALAAWTAVGCLAVLAGTLAIGWSWGATLPDPVAIHWSGGATPDGFGSLAQALVPQGVLTIAFVALFCAVAAGWGQSAMTRRLGIAGAVWITVFMATISLGSLGPQRGLPDAATAPMPSWLLPVAILGPLAIAALVAALVPGDAPMPTTAPVTPDAPRIVLAADERAVWVGHTFSRPGLYVGATLTAVMIALATFLRLWGLFVVPIVLVFLLGAMLSFVTTVNAAGLAVRSSMGWPRTFIPADEVSEASVVDVHAVKEFGGWGWRVGRGGRVGIVPRSGRGILVQRTGGRSLVVVVDGAEQGAALLNTLADRARADRRIAGPTDTAATG